MKVKSATWGSYNSNVDVTDRVNELDEFTVSNETFGGDPHYGVRKKLRIDTGSLVKVYAENETLSKRKIFADRDTASIRNKIEHIFYVNMDACTERRIYIEDMLNCLGLLDISERVPGIEWTGDIPSWFHPGASRESAVARSRSYGCSLAHLKVCEIAKARGYKSFLVLEDDVWFKTEDFYTFVANLPDDYDIAYFYNHPVFPSTLKGKPINNYWGEISGQPGCYGHLVNARCINWMTAALDPSILRERHDRWGAVCDRVLEYEATMAGLKIIRSIGDAIIHDFVFGSERLDPHASKLRRATIESDITHHCNLSCEHCSHFSPFFSESFYRLEQFEKDIRVLSTMVHTDAYLLLGGEPLLNPNIREYVRILRESQITDRVVLVTNGLLLHATSIDNLTIFDRIEISMYPEISYVRMEEFIASNKGRLPHIHYRNRPDNVVMFSETALTSEQQLNSFRVCCAPDTCNFIMNGRYYLCAQSAKGHYVDPRFPSDEGIDIHAPNAGIDLKHFVYGSRAGARPLRSCMFCNMHGAVVPHAQKRVAACAAI
jgi:uncharacterized radical SAM superfamily Fe-S cluster-containing enzyme